jgi:transcription initiation factor TFIIH subunit 2
MTSITTDDSVKNEIKNAFHKWEHSGRAWELLEQVDGRLTVRADTAQWETEAPKLQQMLSGCVRGLIRSLVVIVDLSRNGLKPRDFGMPRIRIITQQLQSFFSSFIDQNPLSEIAVISTSGYRATLQSQLSGNLEAHLASVATMANYDASGEPSLLTSIEMAMAVLSNARPFSTREILLIYGSMNTCDSAPIDTIEQIVGAEGTGAIVSAIGFDAKIFAIERIVKASGGIYRIPTCPEQFEDLLLAHVRPPAWSDRAQAFELVPFGFVKPVTEMHSFDVGLVKGGGSELPGISNVACPKCGTRVFVSPGYCPCCGILVMSPAHLTRSLHHLRPLCEFELESVTRTGESCDGCGILLDAEKAVCRDCGNEFCKACDKFIHDCLQNCPGCLEQKGS